MEGAIMDFGIREIGSLAFGLALSGGPVAVLIVLIAILNRQDRRQGRLLSLAARQLTGEEVRGEVTIEAHCPLLAGSGEVRVDVGVLDGGVARQVIERLRQALPPAVRLAVDGAPDPAHPVERLEARRVLRARPS
jgi:L-alanine-DL-glutamate epimerase-like enolase superfamily enzyme